MTTQKTATYSNTSLAMNAHIAAAQQGLVSHEDHKNLRRRIVRQKTTYVPSMTGALISID